MLKQTILYQEHQRQGASFIAFAGWEMPLHYGSQLAEHHWVREQIGIFDVSHMGILDIEGDQAQAFLRKMLANDVAKMQETGKALYSCLLNQQGGILDDLIVYYLQPGFYRLVVNAATTIKDLVWLESFAKAFAVKITPRRDLAILALQGPQIDSKVPSILNAQQTKMYQRLRPFTAMQVNDWLIARTGYTGEKGIEIMLPASQACFFWQQALQNQIKPIGLGARDSLRLEAGFNLNGQDMDETVSPLESNLSWTVDWSDPHREFIGWEALHFQKQQGANQQLVGLILPTKHICRPKMKVWVGTPESMQPGVITSGGFSPSLGQSIGLARIPIGDFTQAFVDIRGQKVEAKVVKPPFVAHGKSRI